MPNHCTNVLHIDGEFHHRQEFVDRNKGFHWGDVEKKKEYHDLSFHASVPIPQRIIKAHLKNSSNDEWYRFCNNKWGTKWDCYEITLYHTDRYTCYSFETAWCPPIAWVVAVSKKYPHLKFNVEWAEEGGEGGAFMYHGGDCFHEHHFNTQEWRDFMGYEEDENDEW